MRSRKRLLIAALAVTAVAAVSTATITHANADTQPTTAATEAGQPAGVAAGPTGGLQLAPVKGTGGTANITSVCWVFQNPAPQQDRPARLVHATPSVACESGVAYHYTLISRLFLRLSDNRSELQGTQQSDVDTVGAQFAANTVSAPCRVGMWWADTDVYITLVDGTVVSGTITSTDTPIYNC